MALQQPLPDDGRRRVAIENVSPEIDGGRFPAKATVGETLTVAADIFADGHDTLAAWLFYRHATDSRWRTTPMALQTNDRWEGTVPVERVGVYELTLQAWVDGFRSWREGFRKKRDAGQDVAIELRIGAELVEDASERAEGADQSALAEAAATMASEAETISRRVEQALEPELLERMDRNPDRRWATDYPRTLRIRADPQRARFSTWYELFPRSCAPEPDRHGTFDDVIDWLPYVASLGFDVLYLPPIHPIGRTHRKGPNNAPTAGPEDPGSPWAIGAAEGGHKAVHPDLGTLADFRRLVDRAAEHGLEIALDIAFQCSPDHPYVHEHPEWFRHRPDGSIQYAENPPKKYQDIYPFDFESEDWAGLWEELRSVVAFWIEQGVTIFRVDNPHTKPFAFWEWLIGTIKAEHPETIFLAEAFTRPKVMHRLAKLGFSQSYTYFAWRNTRDELTRYLRELTQTEALHYFRPNFWPNTPDILTEYLQTGGRPAFLARLVLAATLAANYGIYGPAFELGEHTPREPGSEEYRNSEKYEIRQWDVADPDSLREPIRRVNAIRRANPALQRNDTLRFLPLDNDQLIGYSKSDETGENVILTIVNLDPHHTHAGWIELPLEAWGIAPDQAFQVHDLLSDARYVWTGRHNYVELTPHLMPAHVFRVRHRVRTEADFEYFM